MDILELKKEIFHPRSSDPKNSTITFELSTRLACNQICPEEIGDYFQKYAQIIGNLEIHVNAVSSRLLKWSFAQIPQNDWPPLFVQVEKIIIYLNESNIQYVEIILHEKIAHRYADCLISCGKYKSEVKQHYHEAFFLAKKLNRGKNMISSMYYAYIVWDKIEDQDEALICAKIISELKDPHLNGIWASCHEKIKQKYG